RRQAPRRHREGARRGLGAHAGPGRHRDHAGVRRRPGRGAEAVAGTRAGRTRPRTAVRSVAPPRRQAYREPMDRTLILRSTHLQLNASLGTRAGAELVLGYGDVATEYGALLETAGLAD